MGACRVAAQKLPQQFIGTGKFAIINDPYFADIGGQFANAAGQKFAAHHGADAVRFEITANQVCFGGVARGVQWFHGAIFAWFGCCLVLKFQPFADAGRT